VADNLCEILLEVVLTISISRFDVICKCEFGRIVNACRCWYKSWYFLFHGLAKSQGETVVDSNE
jgi:hypothetical protein